VKLFQKDQSILMFHIMRTTRPVQNRHQDEQGRNVYLSLYLYIRPLYSYILFIRYY